MIAYLMVMAALQAAPAPVQPAVHWRYAPVTAGAWSYRPIPGGSEAVFQDAYGPQLTLRCTMANRLVTVVRRGGTPGAVMFVRTTSIERSVPGTGVLGARDPLLDAFAFSRGRVAVEVAGTPRLIVPSWPEPARAVENCRK